MDKLVTAFYTAVFLITEYGRKALIVLSALLSAVLLGMQYVTFSLLAVFVMLIAICRYYDCKYAEEVKRQ